MNRLGTQEIETRLNELDGWSLSESHIEKTFTFHDFVEAFGFMTRVALVAEKMDHHPDWQNVFRTVVVQLTTHDAGGVTEKDVALAAAMDRLAGARNAGS